jgi:hypothetical protein
MTFLPNDFLNWETTHETEEDKGPPFNGLDLIRELPNDRRTVDVEAGRVKVRSGSESTSLISFNTVEAA